MSECYEFFEGNAVTNLPHVTLPETLRFLRNCARLTIEQMAAAVDMPVTSYQYYESNKYKKSSLPSEMAAKVIRVLSGCGVTMDDATRAELFGIDPKELKPIGLYPKEGEFAGKPLAEGYLPIVNLILSEGKAIYNHIESIHREEDSRSIVALFPKQLVERMTHDYRYLRVHEILGDGMSPALQNGDVVLVDTSKADPSPPGIFLIFDGVDAVAKRLEMTKINQKEVARVVSDNPTYSSYETEHRLRIIGRVVWFSRIIG